MALATPMLHRLLRKADGTANQAILKVSNGRAVESRLRPRLSGDIDVAHNAHHRLELRQLAHALEVFADVRLGTIAFNVLGASPLPVVDDASTIVALVKAGRDISG